MRISAVLFLVSSFALNMEAIIFSETSSPLQSTRHCNSEAILLSAYGTTETTGLYKLYHSATVHKSGYMHYLCIFLQGLIDALRYDRTWEQRLWPAYDF
jgi:hypothetical protein